jgi:hypothetical protein
VRTHAVEHTASFVLGVSLMASSRPRDRTSRVSLNASDSDKIAAAELRDQSFANFFGNAAMRRSNNRHTELKTACEAQAVGHLDLA